MRALSRIRQETERIIIGLRQKGVTGARLRYHIGETMLAPRLGVYFTIHGGRGVVSLVGQMSWRIASAVRHNFS